MSQIVRLSTTMMGCQVDLLMSHQLTRAFSPCLPVWLHSSRLVGEIHMPSLSCARPSPTKCSHSATCARARPTQAPLSLRGGAAANWDNVPFTAAGGSYRLCWCALGRSGYGGGRSARWGIRPCNGFIIIGSVGGGRCVGDRLCLRVGSLLKKLLEPKLEASLLMAEGGEFRDATVGGPIGGLGARSRRCIGGCVGKTLCARWPPLAAGKRRGWVPARGGLQACRAHGSLEG